MEDGETAQRMEELGRVFHLNIINRVVYNIIRYHFTIDEILIINYLFTIIKAISKYCIII